MIIMDFHILIDILEYWENVLKYWFCLIINWENWSSTGTWDSPLMGSYLPRRPLQHTLTSVIIIIIIIIIMISIIIITIYHAIFLTVYQSLALIEITCEFTFYNHIIHWLHITNYRDIVLESWLCEIFNFMIKYTCIDLISQTVTFLMIYLFLAALAALYLTLVTWSVSGSVPS